MSTPAPAPASEPVTITIISHTGLLYWWPVWAAGFILAGLTWVDGERLATVPEGTKVSARGDKTYELTMPDGPNPALKAAAKASEKGEDAFPVRVSGSRNYGMVFIAVLLLVILGSNAPLRGLWSLVALLALLLVTLVLAFFDLWGPILEALGNMHIGITLAGYLLTSVVLFVFWVVAVFGFDRLRYIQFSVGQFVVRQEIGDARAVYDTNRVALQKRRSDLFRHWILGLGSGDLVVTVPNMSKEIVLPNVLFVDYKVRVIADLMKTRQVVVS